MKLDCECVRDLLLCLESEQTVIEDEDGDLAVQEIDIEDICTKMSGYSRNTIFYTVSKLNEGGYIDASIFWSGNSVEECCVNYITYLGHEFLETIRPETVWQQTTSIAGKVGTYSLQAIAKIAEGVATAAINKLISSS